MITSNFTALRWFPSGCVGHAVELCAFCSSPLADGDIPLSVNVPERCDSAGATYGSAQPNTSPRHTFRAEEDVDGRQVELGQKRWHRD